MKRIKVKVNNKKPNKKGEQTPTEALSAEALLKAVQDLKAINDRIIALLDGKLKDFHDKLDNINTRLENLEEINGVTYEKSEPDVAGGTTEGGVRNSD